MYWQSSLNRLVLTALRIHSVQVAGFLNFEFQFGIDVLLFHLPGLFHQLFMMRLEIFQLLPSIRSTGDEHEKNRDDKDSQGGRGEHSTQYGKADGAAGHGACTRGKYQW